MPSSKRSRAAVRRDSEPATLLSTPAPAALPRAARRSRQAAPAAAPTVVVSALSRSDRLAALIMIASALVGVAGFAIGALTVPAVATPALVAFGFAAYAWDRTLWQLATRRMSLMMLAAAAVAVLSAAFLPILAVFAISGAYLARRRGRGLVSPLALGPGVALSLLGVAAWSALVVVALLALPALCTNMVQSRLARAA